MPNLLSPGTPFAGRYGPDAILTASGAPVTSTAVTIYQSDGSTTATLYTDQTKATTATNPVTTDGYGNLAFYADPGIYVLSFVVGGVATTKTVMVDPWYADAAWNTYAVTAATTILSGDCVFASASSAALTITLPSPAAGARVLVAKTDSSANVVTVTAPSGVIQGPSPVAGTASASLSMPGSYYGLVGDGTNYNVVAGGGGSLPVPGASGDVLTAYSNVAGAYHWAPPVVPTQAYGAGRVSSSAQIIANTLTYLAETPTLQPGIYLISAAVTIAPNSVPAQAEFAGIYLQLASATGLFLGPTQGAGVVDPSQNGVAVSFTVTTIADITGAGTVEFMGSCGVDATGGQGATSGWTYVQIL